MTTILEAVDWVRRKQHTDADVRAVFTHALINGDHASLSDFARDDVAHFLALYEACVDMVEQIPEHQLRQAGKGKPQP